MTILGIPNIEDFETLSKEDLEKIQSKINLNPKIKENYNLYNGNISKENLHQLRYDLYSGKDILMEKE